MLKSACWNSVGRPRPSSLPDIPTDRHFALNRICKKEIAVKNSTALLPAPRHHPLHTTSHRQASAPLRASPHRSCSPQARGARGRETRLSPSITLCPPLRIAAVASSCCRRLLVCGLTRPVFATACSLSSRLRASTRLPGHLHPSTLLPFRHVPHAGVPTLHPYPITKAYRTTPYNFRPTLTHFGSLSSLLRASARLPGHLHPSTVRPFRCLPSRAPLLHAYPTHNFRATLTPPLPLLHPPPSPFTPLTYLPSSTSSTLHPPLPHSLYYYLPSHPKQPLTSGDRRHHCPGATDVIIAVA